MGCDIHLHTEVKINGNWHHYSECNISRCYAVFGKMANVRNSDEHHITPISEPKGLPEDLTFLTKFRYAQIEPDAHSESWLNAEEIQVLCDWIGNVDALEWFKPHKEFGYLCGNDWHIFLQYREDYPNEIEDIRFVFWFDN